MKCQFGCLWDSFFSSLASLAGMKQDELYKSSINHDPGMTLTYFTAMSIKVAHA